MNEGICDLRFAICDLIRSTGALSLEEGTLSSRPRFSGVCKVAWNQNRFSGFACLMETAKAVQGPHSRRLTPLKRGVNESANVRFQSFARRMPGPGAPRALPQIENRKSKI